MDARPIVIELAGEPEGVGRPRFVRRTGVAFTPADTRKYQAALRLAAQQAMRGGAPLDGPVSVMVAAYFPIPASWSKRKREQALSGLIGATVKPDCDNILKQLDALNQVVFVDDKQVVQATVHKRYSERPALRIEVMPLAELVVAIRGLG